MTKWFVTASALALLLAIALPSVASMAAAAAPEAEECSPKYWGLVPIPHACAEADTKPATLCVTVYRRDGEDPTADSCAPWTADAAAASTVCVPKDNPAMCARASVEDGVCTIFYFDLDPRWSCFDPLDATTTAALPKCVGGDAPGRAIACARYSPEDGVCTWVVSGGLEQPPESCWKPVAATAALGGLGSTAAYPCVLFSDNFWVCVDPATSDGTCVRMQFSYSRAHECTGDDRCVGWTGTMACIYQSLPGGPCWNVKVNGMTVSDSCAPDFAMAAAAPTEGCTPAQVGSEPLSTRACWDYNAVNDACVRVYHNRMLVEECIVFVGPPIG